MVDVATLIVTSIVLGLIVSDIMAGGCAQN